VSTDFNVTDLGSPGRHPMSDLVVIVYPTEAKAEEMRQKLLSPWKEYLILLLTAERPLVGAPDPAS
jgi:hypothetical protein